MGEGGVGGVVGEGARRCAGEVLAVAHLGFDELVRRARVLRDGWAIELLEAHFGWDPRTGEILREEVEPVVPEDPYGPVGWEDVGPLDLPEGMVVDDRDQDYTLAELGVAPVAAWEAQDRDVVNPLVAGALAEIAAQAAADAQADARAERAAGAEAARAGSARGRGTPGREGRGRGRGAAARHGGGDADGGDGTAGGGADGAGGGVAGGGVPVGVESWVAVLRGEGARGVGVGMDLADLAGLPGSAALAGLLGGIDVAGTDRATGLEVLAGFKRLEAWAAAGAAAAAGHLAGVEEIYRNPRTGARVVVTGTEIAMRLGVSRTEGDRLALVGRGMAGVFAPTGVALGAGRIDFRKAQSIITRLQHVPAQVAWHVQEVVLPGAGRATPAELGRALDAALISVDPQDAEARHERARAGRHVNRTRALADGMGSLYAVLPAQDCVQVDLCLDAIATAAKTDGDTRTIDQLRADALTALANATLTFGTTHPDQTTTSTGTTTTTGPGTRAGAGVKRPAARPATGNDAGNSGGGGGAGCCTATTPGPCTCHGAEPGDADADALGDAGAGGDASARAGGRGEAPEGTSTGTDVGPGTVLAPDRRGPEGTGAPGTTGKGSAAPPGAGAEGTAVPPGPPRPHDRTDGDVDNDHAGGTDADDDDEVGSDGDQHGTVDTDTAAGGTGVVECLGVGAWWDRLPGMRVGDVRVNRTQVHLTLPAALALAPFEDPEDPATGGGDGWDEPPAAGDVALLHGYGPITRAQALALAAGGVWRRILTDPATGTVLDVGRTRYRAPADLDAYVRIRDRSCIRPGCSVPAHRCQLDHQTPWAHGGRTTAENLGPACPSDHSGKTAGAFAVHQPAPGTFVWITPTGHIYTRHPGGTVTMTLPGTPTAARIHADITAHTARTQARTTPPPAGAPTNTADDPWNPDDAPPNF